MNFLITFWLKQAATAAGVICFLYTIDDPLEFFEIECDEDETDCTKCCACDLEKKEFLSETMWAFDVHILH